MGVVFISTFFLDEILFQAYSREFIDNFHLIVKVNLLVLALCFKSSLLCRLISGQYRIWQNTSLTIFTFWGIVMLKVNLIGVRWVLPEIFLNELVWDSFYYFFGGICAYFYASLYFQISSAKIRGGVVFGITALLLFMNLSHYMPDRERRKIALITPRPPVIDIFEEDLITSDEFQAEIEKIFD